mgnify:CR=1 FL=1
MHEIFLSAEPLFFIGTFPFTNTLLVSLVAVGVIALGGHLLNRRYAEVPGTAQSIVEVVYEGLADLMDSVLGERKKSEQYLPFVATIFVFILVSNWLGILPGVGSIGIEEGHHFTPLLRSPASDLNFTLALAIISFLTIEITGVLTLGLLKYGGKFVNFRSPVDFAVGLIELVSNLGRLISFSFRLFGNIFAGEVMILVAAFFLPYFLPVPLMAFEVFVGFIQAVVFAMLTLFFIKLAVMEPHGETSH